MRKTILLFALISSSFLLSQFPGNNVKTLLNNDVMPIQLEDIFQQFGYKNFYQSSNFGVGKNYKSTDKYSTNTPYNELVGKTFKITEITPTSDTYEKNIYLLKLENKEIGTIYYKYNPEYESSFELKILNPSQEIFCNQIEKEIDKFDKSITYRTPTYEGVGIEKVIKGKSKVYYLSITTPGSTLNVNEKGVIILLNNGMKISKPNQKIDVEAGSGSDYVYSAFFSLNENDLKLLLQNQITDFRLYIYDNSINEDKRNQIQQYLKCLIQK